MRRSDSPLSPRAHLQIFTFHLPDPRISSPKLSDFRIPPLLNDSLSFIDQPSPNWFHSPSVLFFSSAVVDTHPLQISSHLHFLGCLLLAGSIEFPPVCSHQCGGLSGPGHCYSIVASGPPRTVFLLISLSPRSLFSTLSFHLLPLSC